MSEILKIEPIDNWLKKNNWAIYNHQIETLKLSENGYDVLLVAPTGGGKKRTTGINTSLPVFPLKTPRNPKNSVNELFSRSDAICIQPHNKGILFFID